MAHCERSVLFIQSLPCPPCDVLLIPILAIKTLSTCYFTHGHTSLMIHDKNTIKI